MILKIGLMVRSLIICLMSKLMNRILRIVNVRNSKFQNFDICKNCRIYVSFLGNDGNKVSIYYDRPKSYSDITLTFEAKQIAIDFMKRGQFKQILSIYIARTMEQVKEIENIL